MAEISMRNQKYGKYGTDKRLGLLVREPGGSIGTNFGSKAHSDF